MRKVLPRHLSPTSANRQPRAKLSKPRCTRSPGRLAAEVRRQSALACACRPGRHGCCIGGASDLLGKERFTLAPDLREPCVRAVNGDATQCSIAGDIRGLPAPEPPDPPSAAFGVLERLLGERAGLLECDAFAFEEPQSFARDFGVNGAVDERCDVVP